jgi:hypothetical protein
MSEHDVTGHVMFATPDDEGLPLTRCICGETWNPWSGPVLSVYADSPTECERCHRRFYFRNNVRVFEVID